MAWSLRAGVSALIAASGVLWLVAAAERWWPACKPGDFDTVRCLTRQDDSFGYIAPAEPWTPLGNAAQTAGVSMALLAIGVAVLPWLWLPRRPGLTAAVGLPAVGILVVAVDTWSSGATGEPAAVPGLLAAIVVWCVGLPSALTVVAIASHDDTSPRTRGWKWAVVFLLAMSTPLAEAFLGPLFVGYHSHDYTPWAEAVTAVFLVAAAMAVWLSTKDARHAGDPEPIRVGGQSSARPAGG